MLLPLTPFSTINNTHLASPLHQSVKHEQDNGKVHQDVDLAPQRQRDIVLFTSFDLERFISKVAADWGGKVRCVRAQLNHLDFVFSESQAGPARLPTGTKENCS